MNPLTGIPLAVDSHLVGSKCAYQFGDGPIYLSPAMHDLIAHADGDELARLLAAIPLKRLPSMELDFSVPMFSKPPVWE